MNFTDHGRPTAAAPDEAKRKYRVPALEKGLDILELLSRTSTPMTVTQISGALKRSVSELFRIIQALEFKRYIEMSRTDEGYVLTNRLFALSMVRVSTKTLHDVSLPVMRGLAKDSTQSCHLAVSSDDQMVVVARIEAPSVLGFSVRVGYRRPILDSVSGIVLFAFQPPALRQAWLERLSLHATKDHIDAFVARSEQARTAGYASTSNDFVQGVIDLSAPIMAGNRVVAALSIPFVHRPAPCSTVDETITMICDSAAEISREIHDE